MRTRPLLTSLVFLFAYGVSSANPPRSAPLFQGQNVETPSDLVSELRERLRVLEQAYQSRSVIASRNLAAAQMKLDDLRARLESEKVDSTKTKETLEKITADLKLLTTFVQTRDEAQTTLDRLKRRREIDVMKARLETLTRCVGFIGSMADGLVKQAQTAESQLRFGSLSNVAEISPNFVKKVQKLGKRVPKGQTLLEGLLGGSSSPFVAIGISLVNLVVPPKKQEPEFLKDIEDVIAVADALVIQREVALGAREKFEILKSSALGVSEQANDYFAKFRELFRDGEQGLPLEKGWIAQTNSGHIRIAATVASILKDIDRFENPTKEEDGSGNLKVRTGSDPDVVIQSLQVRVQTLQGKASALLGAFKPLVSDLARAWDYQSQGTRKVIESLGGQKEIEKLDNLNGSARIQLFEKLSQWEKESNGFAAEIRSGYGTELSALEGLIQP